MKKNFALRLGSFAVLLVLCMAIFTGCGKTKITISFPEGTQLTSVSCDQTVSKMTTDDHSIELVVDKDGTYTLECSEESTGDFTLAVSVKGSSVSLDENTSQLDTALGVK